MKTITILVPAYNESENLTHLIAELQKITKQKTKLHISESEIAEIDLSDYNWEYLFVNDGSLDNTLELLAALKTQNARVNYVNLSRNFGKENALLAGMDFATGDAVIIMDADLQDPPELIPELIKYWEEGYDDVYARRTSRKGETFLKKFTSKMYYKVLQSLTKVEIQKDT